MNTAQLWNKIGDLRPNYSEKYRPMIEAVSNKLEKTGTGNIAQFGAFYQTYMYACIIGLRLGIPKYLEPREAKQEFAVMSKWKPLQIRDYVVMMLLNRSDSFGYSWMSLENAKEETVDAFCRAICKEMEGYANTGFEYIQNKWDNERVMFNSPTVFVDILKGLGE